MRPPSADDYPSVPEPTETAVIEAFEPERRRTYLLVRGEEEATTVIYPLEEGRDLIIGRAPNVGVVLQDSSASRIHARLSLSGGSLTLEDLGSHNGTRVNNDVLRSESRTLSPADVVRIGRTEIVVVRTTGDPALAGRDDESSSPGRVHKFGSIVVADVAMARVYETVQRLAQVRTTVLILGETGVGKELVAQSIHQSSPRASAPFVRLNCAALPDQLLESELFGYEKGAFTGADRRKIGYVEAANGGTLFLDEAGELSPVMQAKLLSVIENRSILRLGSTQEVPVDIRLVCATHRDLEEEVKAGRFRQDLFYRLSTFRLRVPPLRERPAEVRLLAEFFAREFAGHMDRDAPEISVEAAAALERYPWPGNVRELRNAIEHAVILADAGVLRVHHLPEEIRNGAPVFATPVPTAGATAAPMSSPPVSSVPMSSAPVSAVPTAPVPAAGGAAPVRSELLAMERRRIEEALAAEGGNQTRAAERLGMPRRTLVAKLAKYRAEDQKK